MTFHGQWNPPVDEVLFRNYFDGVRDGFFIECGAGDGVHDSSCLFFEEELGWNGVNIEPCAAVFERLKVNRPRARNLPVAVGKRLDNKKCLIISDGNGVDVGMQVGPTTHLDSLRDRGYQTREENVRFWMFARILRQYGRGRLDLLVLDVEGHELEVLDGIKGLHTPLPDVVCVEYPLVGLEPLNESLKRLGYTFDFVSYNNAFFHRGERTVLGWGATSVMS